MRLIAATQNKHKLKEIQAIAEKMGMHLLSTADLGYDHLEIEETGSTFEENSLIKAKAVCEITGEAAVADDTGLCIDALDGAPGVFSARFAGDEHDDEANIAKVLELMKDVPFEKRTAMFVCVITICYPDGRVVVSRGECHGKITTEKIGTEGFGYDSIFVPDGYDKTFGQLGEDLKNVIGHRAKAVLQLEKLI